MKSPHFFAYILTVNFGKPNNRRKKQKLDFNDIQETLVILTQSLLILYNT